MPKTGYKYTKQQPNKGGTHMLRKSSASSKLHRVTPGPTKGGNDKSHLRSSDTIKRLKMYSNGKAVRNKEGKVVGGQFMMGDRSGDTKITAATGRIAPDRRWFGNTRVVGSKELDTFRQEMSEKAADPYSVVLKRKKLPLGLLQDAAEQQRKNGAAGNVNAGLLANEPFEHTFGKSTQRKRVKLDQLLVSRREERKKRDEMRQKAVTGGEATPVARSVLGGGGDNNNDNEKGDDDESGGGGDAAGYAALLAAAQDSSELYREINTREGIVPWGRDKDVEMTSGEGVDWRRERKDDLFTKGQSKRIWGEFYKVVDSSDVVLHVIDARNVPGTRCTHIENHIRKNARHKHLVFVLNKIDLVPNWVAKRWMGELAAVRPTVAFHASMTQAFGKGALISLLRQFSKLHEGDKKQISVGVVGYPNVGKSSVINTLISKTSCKVAPIPGETKIWQYITLMKRIYLIDCPGVVVDTAGDTEVDSVLKGVVRSERLECPEEYIDAILKVVRREHVAAQYKMPKSGEGTWTTTTDLLEKIAQRAGRLRKGGEPCLRSSAITIINDYQRGKLPHFVPPPDLKEEEGGVVVTTPVVDDSAPAEPVVLPVQQDLDAIGEENLKSNDEENDGTDSAKQEGPVDDEGGQDSNAGGEEEDSEDDDDDEESEEEEEIVVQPIITAGGEWDDD